MRSENAWGRRRAPRASGRAWVRSTWPSKRWSQRSLAMQPAPLTASPPIKTNPINEALGGADGVSQRDHPAGINKMSRPDGLFQRTNSIQGRRPEVLLFTGNEI